MTLFSENDLQVTNDSLSAAQVSNPSLRKVSGSTRLTNLIVARDNARPFLIGQRA
jgi:hypothetical protein